MEFLEIGSAEDQKFIGVQSVAFENKLYVDSSPLFGAV
jgi:hypothetical protein